MDLGDVAEAEKTFRQIIEKIYNADTYSFLGLATLAYKKGLEAKQTDQDSQDRLLVRAYNKYLDILATDQTNCFACIGLANILAYFNKTEDAQEIFKLMAQSNPSLYQPLMNQAHLSIGEKNFEIAINLYQNILEKFLPNDLKTEMFLAKAYFRKGDYETCKKICMTLIARYPQSIELKFNLALCLFNLADTILQSEVRRVH